MAIKAINSMVLINVMMFEYRDDCGCGCGGCARS